MTKIGFAKSLAFVLSFLALISFVACENCDRRVRDTNKINNCSAYDNKETLCNSAVLHDNTRCHFDPSTRLCSPLAKAPTPGEEANCDPKGKEECDTAPTCIWNTLTLKCDAKK
jgi:hypothetical protein